MRDMNYSYDRPMERSVPGTLVGQVMGLLAFSMLFTAGGAVVGRMLGPGGMLISIVGSIGCLIALWFLKTKPVVNLGLFYAFSVFEGMALGLIIDSYVARGLGSVVINAATTTAGLTLALGAYAWTTKRDLSGMGGYLMAGLLAVILAGLVGIFIQSTMFHFIVSAATAMLFSGYVMYDIQRLKYAEGGSGDAILMAVSIYLSVFNLFLAILRIFGFLSSSDE
ncbi:MAG: Bax inhibitor-1/YccA family protein [Chloroflexi bacterium]|nr:Bax inhibitor-1/YccA family protein [Chloroflexota bacterium]